MSKSSTVTRRRLASISEAAEYLDCHPRTVRRRIADGGLSAYRVGSKMLRVDLDEVDAMLQPVVSVQAREVAA